MILLDDFQIPQQHKDGIDSLHISTLQLVLKELVEVITCAYDYPFDGPVGTPKEFDSWVQSLTIKQGIKLSFYILYLIDKETYEGDNLAVS